MSHHNKRFLAEWESQAAILMALPHENTDWNYILEEVRDCYRRIIETLTGDDNHIVLLCNDKDSARELLKNCRENYLHLIEVDFNDTWTRDYGPLAVVRNERNRMYDFGFNGWGLKFPADKDNLVNLGLCEKGVIDKETYKNQRDFELEGGSVETDGRGTLLTTSRCLCSRNRNGGKNKQELNEILHERLGVEHILWLDYGYLAGDDTDSHIDTLARIAPGDTILFTGCRDVDDEHFEELLKMRAQLTIFRNMYGAPYNLIELPFPSPIFDEQGERLPATYANYLVTERYIYVPTYGQPQIDRLACDTIRIAYPGHEVRGIDCTALIKQHGSLHCATMQLHEGFIVPEVLLC